MKLKIKTYAKKVRRAWLWTRIRQVRFKRWWHKNDRRYGLMWRLGNGVVVLLLLLAVALPVLQNVMLSSSYALSADTLKLVGQTNPTLEKQLTYDAQSRTYQFNKDAIKSTAPDGTNPFANMQAQTGTASGHGKDKSLYALDVPEDFSTGVTYHDVNTGLSFSLVPQFSASPGRVVDGHLVFPLAGGDQGIYTLKDNGLKEDIVVPRANGDTMTFTYKLQLPDTLAAKVIPGSDGNIGIYGADPALYGNISYGSASDQAAVEKARVNGEKTHLVFGLPSPVIKDLNGNSVGQARFQLQGDELSVVASGLSGQKGPVTIDPSVVITSTSDFETTGNNEDNIDFSTSGQITRGALTGGSVSAGWSSQTSLNQGTWSQGGAVYNGYVYQVSGSGAGASLQYAALGSGGTVGSWTTITSYLSQTLYYPDVVAYNGYLYIIGGYNPTSSTVQSAVLYAAINPSTGVPGTPVTSSNSLATGVCRAGVAVYDGYIYITGGSSTPASICGNSSTGLLNSVQYAPIKANGDVGSWTTSTSTFTTARMSHVTFAYNGYLYVIAGTTNGNGANTFKDTQYAPINSDGTIGSWQTSAVQLSTATYRPGATVYDGYVYLVGNGNTNSTAVVYAPLYANGNIGSWQTSSSLSTGTFGNSVLAYNNYIYTFGGSGTLTTVLSAPVDPAGMTAGYATNSNTALGGTNNTVSDAGVAVYNGYIYVVGGTTTGTSFVTTTHYAPISSAGVIGTWTTDTGTGALNTAAGDACVTIYNGYMYVVGGFNASGTASTVVQYSAISSSNGSLGAWSTTTALTNGIANHCAVAYNGYIYTVGTNGSGTSSTVQYAQLSASGGVSGSWSTTTTLNTARDGEQMLAYGNTMYVLGGTDGTNILTSVEYAPIHSDGTLGSWTQTTGTSSMSTGREFFSAFAANGYLYALGGQTTTGGTITSAVEYAPIASNGSVGAWAANTAFTPGTDTRGQVAYYDGFVYSVSGLIGGSRVATSYSAVVNNGGAGSANSWASTSSFINARYEASSVAYNGYLYLLGGYDGSVYYNDVQFAPIASNGTLGAWHYTDTSTDRGVTFNSGFSQGRYGAQAVAYNGYLYIVGGESSSGPLSDVQMAALNSNGTVGTWSTANNFINARYEASSVAYNGYLYLLGGYDGSVYYNDVQFAPIASNGTLGAWHYTDTSTDRGVTFNSGFSQGRYGAQAVAYNGYLYLAGGNTGAYQSDVQLAPINSNGTIGTWANTTALNVGRAYASMVAANGYMYLFGGDNAGGALGDVQYASINATGQLGPWSATSAFTTARYGSAAAVYNGNLYLLGGYTGSAYQNDVQYASLNVAARVAHYSTLVNLGGAVNVTSLTYNGTLPGNSSVTYRAAGSGAVFGSTALASSISGLGGCFGTTTNTQYVFVMVTLDGSQSGAFPDTNGTRANLTDFTVNYNPVHPPPNIRLRTGQTLQNGNLSVLDTCYP